MTNFDYLLKTIENADRILVINKGEIIELDGL